MPWTRTRGDAIPATTCALVTTRPGETTQPLPSWPRLQAAATPVILTTDAPAAATPREAVTAGLGLATEGIGSTWTPSKTRGKPSRSSRARNPAKSWVVCAGTARSIVCRMRELPMARASGAGAPPRTAPATNHTRIETATSEATPPRNASTTRAGLSRTCRRSRVAGRHGEPLPDRGQHEDPEDQQDGVPQDVVADAVPPLQELRQQPHAQRPTGQEADEGHRADQQPLPVAGHGVAEQQHREQDVDDHGRSPSRRGRADVRAASETIRSGSGRRSPVSHSRSRPASSSTLASSPAVKPHTSRPSTSKAGPT